MKFIQQYKNLEHVRFYILFFGRVVTSMGSLISAASFTLILKNKLGYNATTICQFITNGNVHFAVSNAVAWRKTGRYDEP